MSANPCTRRSSVSVAQRWTPAFAFAGALLFFFGLGAASVVVSLGVMAVLFRGNIPMVYTVSNGEFEPSIIVVVLTAGMLTALASFRMAEPSGDGPRRHTHA